MSSASLASTLPLLSSGLVAVVMTAVIVFATVFFTGRPDAKPLVGAFATHLRCPLQGFFLRGEGVVTVRLCGSNACGDERRSKQYSSSDSVHPTIVYAPPPCTDGNTQAITAEDTVVVTL